MDNDSKIEQAQRDIRAANDTVQLARGDSDTREALHLALSACELMAAVISDQQEQIEELRAKVFEDPSTYDLRKGRR
jgi:hypothetical protein